MKCWNCLEEISEHEWQAGHRMCFWCPNGGETSESEDDSRDSPQTGPQYQPLWGMLINAKKLELDAVEKALAETAAKRARSQQQQQQQHDNDDNSDAAVTAAAHGLGGATAPVAAPQTAASADAGPSNF